MCNMSMCAYQVMHSVLSYSWAIDCQSQAHLTTVADQYQHLALHQVCQLATHSHCAHLLGILLCTQHPFLMCSTDCYTFEGRCIAAWHIDAHVHCHMHDLVYHCAAALYMLPVYADGIAELWLMILSILMTQHTCHGVQRGLIVSVKSQSSDLG